MNPACPNCIEFECPCPGVSAELPVAGCYTPPADTTYNSSMIGSVDMAVDSAVDVDVEPTATPKHLSDRGSLPPVNHGRAHSTRPQTAAHPNPRPTAIGMEPRSQPASATGPEGFLASCPEGPVAASVPPDMTPTGRRILAILTGRADPCSVAAGVLYGVLEHEPDLKRRFRQRHGTPALIKIMLAAMPRAAAAVP